MNKQGFNKEEYEEFMIGLRIDYRHYMWLGVNYSLMKCMLNYNGTPIHNICLN